MYRGNGVATLILGGLLSISFSLLGVKAEPLVIGYERFHSEAPSVEGGRLLFNELGCVNCHKNPTQLPERKGPRLDGLTTRAHPDWVRAFLENPNAVKPGSNMPQMGLSQSEVEAIIHYIATLDTKAKVPKAFKFVNATRGQQLYRQIGCVACHAPDPYNSDQIADTYPWSLLANLEQKYDIHSLSSYLYRPHAVNPHGRMPQFTLEKEDGGDIAAFLLNYENGDSTDYPRIPSFDIDASLANKGKEILVSHNCAACHDIPKRERLPRLAQSKIEAGRKIPANHPEYNLSEGQVKSIERFLEGAKDTLPARTYLEALNCVACHKRDGIGGSDTVRQAYFHGDPDLGDSGRFPPPLIDAGRKFNLPWLKEAIAGDKRIRPYLKVQMPDFGKSVDGLAQLLVEEDGLGKPRRARKTNLEAGRKLLGTQGGLNCITCHDWGDRRSLGISALNLSNLHERLQLDWLHDYMIDPNAHRPNTLMPSFWPKGIASNQAILDGNTQAQINAIYSFSKYGKALPDGFPDLNTTEYELIPVDRPIVQRSFLEGVGTHALLAGFPQGVHLAIDGKSGNPAMMWKGRFFDAYNTWFSRFPELEKPLGDDVVRWRANGVSADSQYRGYRFGSDGVPEFLVELMGSIIYERLQPVKDESGNLAMQRTIRYTSESQTPDPRLEHPLKVTVTELDSPNPLTRAFLYQW